MSIKKVIIAMSGGVDSSVTAVLLKDKGFEVIGVTMCLWDYVRNERGCCTLSSVDDARKVADKIGITHYVLNLKNIFEKKVVADFCAEYRRGRTPNPCIRCNQYIKFDALLKKAKQLGVDYVATGHYARIAFDRGSNKYLLKKALDARKDQSYCLYTLTQKQLKHILLPLGGLTKKEVRTIAREKGLDVADKRESQEICFIPDNNYAKFIKEYTGDEPVPGRILNSEGKVIGEHPGIIFYTIGQRKGIGIADKEPLYVTAIDSKNNTIVAGSRSYGYREELIAEKVQFVGIDTLEQPLRVEVKVRYLHSPASATIFSWNKGKVKVQFDQPQWALTPGQAAVFYQGDVVVGGGVISLFLKS